MLVRYCHIGVSQMPWKCATTSTGHVRETGNSSDKHGSLIRDGRRRKYIAICTFLTKTIALSSIPPSLMPVLACHWVYKKCPILLKELSIIKCFWLIYITRTTNQSCPVSEFVLIIVDWNLAANNKIRHNDPLVAAVYIFQLGPSRCSSSK